MKLALTFIKNKISQQELVMIILNIIIQAGLFLACMFYIYRTLQQHFTAVEEQQQALIHNQKKNFFHMLLKIIQTLKNIIVNE